MNIKRTFGKIKLGAKEHSPEILLALGIISGVAAIVTACRATTKVEPIVDNHNKKMKELHEVPDDPDLSCTPEKKEVVKVYTSTALEVAKVYAPAVALEVVSITSFLASYKILHARNVALVSAYTLIDKAFKDYRSRVRAELGEQADLKYLTGAKEEVITKKITDENGKTKTVKETVLTGGEISGYDKFFDETNPNWVRDPESNLWFIVRQQNWANDKFKAQGYLFLNDVYEMLGMEKTKAGQVVGWIFDGKEDIGDNYIDFGIEKGDSAACRRFINGLEPSVLLHFNVDGPILNRLVRDEHLLAEV